MYFKKVFTCFALVLTMNAASIGTVAALPSITSDKGFHEIMIGPVAPFKYDLDGDGKVDNVNIKRINDSSYSLSVNNKANIKVDIDCGIHGVSVLDLNKYDKYKQIAIFQEYSNDYKFVELYSYKNNEIKCIGKIQVSNYKLHINNKSQLSGVAINQFFQTDSIRLYYKYNSNDTLTEIKLPFYSLRHDTITAKVSIKLRKANSASSKVITAIRQGEKVKVIGTDRRNWVLLENSKGVRGWLQTDGDKIIELNKYVDDVFASILRVG